jgi:hypothetical protein
MLQRSFDITLFDPETDANLPGFSTRMMSAILQGSILNLV